MKEDFIIGFFSMVILFAGFYLWGWLVKKFKMNRIVAIIIVIAFISIFVGSVSCLFDPHCKLL